MKTLKEFYQAYAAWLDAGAPQNKPFIRNAGLCHNLSIFTKDYERLLNEMRSEFKAAGLDADYPFNIDEAHYTYSSRTMMHYMNYKRIEWVREHCK